VGRRVRNGSMGEGQNDDALQVSRLLTCCVVHHTDGSCRIVLGGEVDISNTVEVTAVFEQAFRTRGALDIDLSGLTHIDSTMLTLLIKESIRFEESGRPFRVVATSPLVRKVFRITGLMYLTE
jgi:anti-sigma B factor antagonist